MNAGRIGCICLFFPIFILRVNNRSLRKNLIQNIHDRSHQSARIAPHIDNQPFHIFLFKCYKCLFKLFCGITLEFADLYVADPIGKHFGIHTRNIHVFTFHIKFKIFPCLRTINFQMDFCPLFSPYLFYKVGKFHTGRFILIHG